MFQMNKFNLELTEDQMQVIKEGMELMVRLGLGQVEYVHEVLWKMHQKKMGDGSMFGFRNESLMQYKQDMVGFDNGGSYGIGNAEVHVKAHRAYDVEQVVRKALADYRGVTSGVCASTPIQYGDGDMPKCEVIDGTDQ
jgi:hypothetical protein